MIPGKGDDSFFCENNLFIVADGVGREYLDDIAREISFRVIQEAFFDALHKRYSPTDALHIALEKANRVLLEEGRRIGKRIIASVSVAYVRDNIVYFTHLGDTRIYCLQRGEILQLTRDHVMVEEDVQSESQQRPPRKRRAITEALGLREDPPIEVKKFALHQRDLILMATEAFTSRLSNMQILKTSRKSSSVKKLTDRLLSEARRIDREHRMTVGVLGLEQGSSLRIKIPAAITVLLILAFTSMVIWNLYWSKEASRELEIPKIEEARKPPEALPPEVRKNPVPPESKPGKASPAPKNPEPVKEEKKKENLPLKEIQDFITAWSDAWEKSAGAQGDMETYMSFYSEKFASGRFRKSTWKKDKARKNRKKRWISVETNDIKIMDARGSGRVRVRFNQVYKSSNYSVKSRKELLLVKEDEGWKILSERTY
ncbi:MAG: hypothetical protein JRJ01_03155 [Deltaproteobacteria bacterium]|nr:hypothetical protein [Deltaproteobacteria bacterium]